MRIPAYALLRCLPAALLCSRPAPALTVSVSDFRPDVSGVAADTVNLEAGFGDSLSIGAQSHQYRRILTQLLNDGTPRNGVGGASPVVAAVSKGRFQIAYVLWSSPQLRQNGAYNPPPADVASRMINLSGDTASVALGQTLAAAENYPDTANPKRFYGGLNLRPPPSYLNFFASDSNYLAYWGTLAIRGSVRRTTHVQAAGGGQTDTWGRYVPPVSPVICEGYGKIGAGARPGARALKAVLAYETTLGAGNYTVQVRFEDVTAATSQAVTFNRAALPEDLAVAVDSAGNALVLWREANTLFLTGYDSARAVIQAPTQIQTNIVYKDSATEHNYRPYGSAALLKGRFVVAYVASPGVSVYRVVDLPFGGRPFSLGSEWPVSPAGQPAYFANVCAEAGRMAFTWYRRAGAGNDRVMASVWGLQNDIPDSASRIDVDAAQDSVGFGQVGVGWYPWHYSKTPSCALDAAGNLAVAYDNGFSAKAAVVRNAAIYFDSAVFASRVLRIRNGGLAFQPGVDSANVNGFSITGDTVGAAATLALADDSAFTSGATGFQAFGTSFRSAQAFYRYRVRLRPRDTARLITPSVQSLALRANIKPRQVRVDSLRIGSGAWQTYDSMVAYSAFRRRDSLHLVYSGFDLDDEDSLRFTVRLGARVMSQKFSAVKRSAGWIRCAASFAPFDTAAASLTFSLATHDSGGWISAARSLVLGLRNTAPAETAMVIRHRGLDSAGIFWPTRGLRDTLGMRAGDSAWLPRGDTAVLLLRGTDANESLLTLRWFRNGVKLGEQSVAPGVFVQTAISLLSPGLPDTVRVEIADPETTISRTFFLRANRPPRLDSLWLAAYQGKDSVWVRQVKDRIVNFAADSGLLIPLGLPAVVRVFASDSDRISGDSLNFTLTALTAPGGCARGTVACYVPAATSTVDSLLHAFAIPQDFFRFRATDGNGAFAQYTVRLEFPFLDTSGAANRAALQVLASGLDFTLGSVPKETTLVIRLANQGTLPLRIDSVKTGRDEHRWLDASLRWNDSGAAQQSVVQLAPATDRNPLSASGALLITGGVMQISLRLFADSILRDTVLIDTLLVSTNDLSTPLVRVPIRLQIRALPAFSVSLENGGAGLPAFLPTRSTLRFAFSEAVQGPPDGSGLRIYSYRDSLRSPSAYVDIPGRWSPRLRALSKAGVLRRDSLPWADTLLFTPAYTGPAPFSGLRPQDGAFMHRDVIRIRVSNRLVDRTGNALDLRGDHLRRAPGTFDTILTVRIDTSALRVRGVEPGPGAAAWNPDSTLRVRFNGPLRRRDSASAVGVDLRSLGDTNPTVRVTSTLENGKSMGLRALSLANGDSILVIRVLRRPAARDTVKVWLAGSISDSSGDFLDGNGDGYPGYVYGGSDSLDAYTFEVHAWDQGFYVFPNPFRFSDARHRAKGGVSFKNLHTLRGYQRNAAMILRVHTMEGDLVYSSRKSGNASGQSVSLDWDLRNDAGSWVGTGIYIYGLYQGNDRLLKKGKLAVVR